MEIKYNKGQKMRECTFVKEIDHQIRTDGRKLRKAIFQCICGKEFTAGISAVKNGNTKSCGCAKKGNPTHGLHKHPLYRRYWGIIQRCENPKANHYNRYGGRGITTCKEWRNDFKAFYDYVKKLDHYGESGMSLDRERNNEGYKPGNVRWIDKHAQCANQEQGCQNKTGYTGVVKSPTKGSYVAYINTKGIRTSLGTHRSIRNAVQERNDYITENNLTEYPIQIIKMNESPQKEI